MATRQALVRTLAIVALGAAVFGAFMGWVTYALSESADGNSDGTVSTATTLQLILGWVGIIPVGAMAYFAFKGLGRKATAAFAVGLVVWLAWAVLNDAAVHGWDDTMIAGLFG